MMISSSFPERGLKMAMKNLFLVPLFVLLPIKNLLGPCIMRLINTVVVFFRPAHFRCCLSISTRRNPWPIFYDVTSFKSHHGYTWLVSIQSGARVKRKEWMLITTVIPVFQPGIFLPAIQVQFYNVMPVCSGYWCGISCTRCYVMPCKVIIYVVWCAWMITCFFNCTGT